MTIQREYRPILEMVDNAFTGLDGAVIGQDVQLIANYKVIEKTKNYTIFRITGITALSNKRKY